MDNKSVKEHSITTIKIAIEGLKEKGIKVTQKLVSSASNLSIITVRRYWKECNGQPPVSIEQERLSSKVHNRVSDKVERLSPEPKRISSNQERLSSDTSFERLKRTASQRPMGMSRCNPWDF